MDARAIRDGNQPIQIGADLVSGDHVAIASQTGDQNPILGIAGDRIAVQFVGVTPASHQVVGRH